MRPLLTSHEALLLMHSQLELVPELHDFVVLS
jgi:hypothetical protein